MKKFLALLASLAILLNGAPAFAQFGGTPIITGGNGTATGDCVLSNLTITCSPYLELQTFFTSTTGSASINIPQGVAPTTPNNGDIWMTSSGLFYRSGGSTTGPLGTGGGGCSPSTTANGVLTYSGSGSTCNTSAITLMTTPTLSTAAILSVGTLTTGGTGTTTFPYVYLDQGASNPTTWSTNGTELGINAPSGFTGNFLHLAVNGAASTLTISSGGNVTTTGSYTAGSAGQFTWTARGIFTSPAAGTIQLGAADAAASVAQTLQAQSVVAGTSNTAGTNMVIQGSRGTGTGVGGSVAIATASAGSTGTTQNAATNGLVVDTTQFVILGAGTPTCGTGCSSIAAGATNQRMEVTTGSAVTSITVNFSKTLTTAPICTANEEAATPLAVGFSGTPTTSAFVLTTASAVTSAKIMVHCE